MRQSLSSKRTLASSKVKKIDGKPVEFAEQVLGIKLYDYQKELLISISESDRSSILSGHKVGKTTLLCIYALYEYAVKESRVVLVAPTYRQVHRVMWRGIAQLHNRTIGGRLFDTPYAGLQSGGEAQIIGVAAKNDEAFSGISGKRLVFLVDEASGVDENIFEAIRGNSAGGATVVMTGNPTRRSGTFFESHTSKTDAWTTHHVSSEWVAREVKPGHGLASLPWVEECKKEWGEDSPKYSVRVLGHYPTQGDASIVSYSSIRDAIERAKMHVLPIVPTERLTVGVDVARFGDDETVFCARRGDYVYPIKTLRGLDGHEVAGELMRFCESLMVQDERRMLGDPVINIDSIGVGASVVDVMQRARGYEVAAVNVGESAQDKESFSNLRTQLLHGVADFLRAGGMLPEDDKLVSELSATEYLFDSRGRMKAESKDDVKRRLQRSPDRADALALCIYTGAKTQHKPLHIAAL